MADSEIESSHRPQTVVDNFFLTIWSTTDDGVPCVRCVVLVNVLSCCYVVVFSRGSYQEEEFSI